MIDVKSKTCNYPGCEKHPSCNIEGEKEALYCVKHKLDGMIDIKHKKCFFKGCKIRPSCNIEGEKKGLYCLNHKLDGMIDVVSKRCVHSQCRFRPNYNIEGEKKALYCVKHKLDGMIDVKHTTCVNEWCSTIVSKKYDGYCMFCYINMFPNKPLSRNYKTKEYSVIEYIKLKFPDMDWIADKTISGGCSRRRPDLFLDLGYQVIIIEIDENQHIDYDCSCENKRLMELSQDLDHRSIIFIRFNPDDYIKNEIKITSCWGFNCLGICQIKKTKNDEWSKRLSLLEESIRYWTNSSNITNKTVEIIHLFYDEFF